MTRVTITKPTVGGNNNTWGTVNNTALDALAAAINALGTGADTADLTAAVGTNTTDIALKAPIASPTFTGTAAAPTPSAADNTTKIATTAFVQGEIAAKAPLASPALTGSPTAPTQSAADNSTKIATTAYADTALALKAPLASPTLTGTPAAPTAAPGTNTTQLATTAFVAAATATPALNVISGNLGGDASISATTQTTIITSSSIPVGTWVITFGASVVNGGAASSYDLNVAVGGATATFTGQQSVGTKANAASIAGSAGFTCVAVVTVAGTLVFQIYASAAVTVKAATTQNSYAKATGYTAVRIA